MENKSGWKAFLSENTKQLLFAAIILSYFGWVSVDLFLSGEALWFSRLGSAIVAWAIINIGVSREKYSAYLWTIERQRIVNNLNKQTKLHEMSGDSISLTFDLHATQIAQISHHVGLPNSFVENESNKIKEFCFDVERRMEEAPWVEKSKELLREFRELEKEYRNKIKLYTRWQKLFWRLEVVLLVWGTIQWGYGDLLVTWWSS